VTGRGLALAAAALAAACATARGGRGDPDACRPAAGHLAAADSAASLAGEFSLTMTATAGAAAGRTVVGHLGLVPQDSALVPAERSTEPLRGTAVIRLEDVGATRMGDLAASDPAAPGVGVYEQRAPATGAPTIVLRFGAVSNSRGPSPIDAGHTTLFVSRITAEGFAGGWSSSAGPVFPPRRASGYFCAVRTPA
jgi:hypothetical protein